MVSRCGHRPDRGRRSRKILGRRRSARLRARKIIHAEQACARLLRSFPTSADQCIVRVAALHNIAWLVKAANVALIDVLAAEIVATGRSPTREKLRPPSSERNRTIAFHQHSAYVAKRQRPGCRWPGIRRGQEQRSCGRPPTTSRRSRRDRCSLGPIRMPAGETMRQSRFRVPRFGPEKARFCSCVANAMTWSSSSRTAAAGHPECRPQRIDLGSRGRRVHVPLNRDLKVHLGLRFSGG